MANFDAESLTLNSGLDFDFHRLEDDGTEHDRSEDWFCHRRSFLLAGLLGLGGCKSWGISGMGRSGTSKSADSDKTIYVSTMARIWGAAPARVDGVGMVSDLAGTGSPPPPSHFRERLAEDLRVRNVPEPNKLLSETWTSLVLLQGFLPAGSRKGTSFDVFVGLEPGSTTTSLENGFLMPARLSSQRSDGGRVLQGKLAGTATGPVVINQLFDGDSRTTKVTGVVPGGGRTMVDRQIGFQTKSEYRSIRDAMAVTASINARFNYYDNSQLQPVAKAKNDATIDLEIPEIYLTNVHRYLHVVRHVPIGESVAEQVSRLELLEQQLQDPATAEIASLRLEAIGESGWAILERGLRHPDPKVRFMAAMSLIYQGKPNACEELGRLAEEQWAFRWHALTALGALPDPSAKQALRKLLHAKSVETRYGAVQCLVQRSETDQDVTVENFGPGDESQHTFVVKTIYSTANPIIHLARFKQPEVVVFNPDQALKPGLLFVIPGWTVQSFPGGVVEIQQFQLDGRDRTVRCSDQVTDVLRTLGKMNGTYTLVVRLLKQAAEEDSLEGRLVINALPKAERAYDPSNSLGLPEMFQGGMDNPATHDRSETGSSEVSAEAGDSEAGDSEGWVDSDNEWITTNPAQESEHGSTPPTSQPASRFKWPWQS